VADPCFLSSIGTFRLNGYRSIPVPLDDEGMTPAGLRAALAAGVRAVVCTPRAHNPTGASFTAGRAAELRALLVEHPEVLVIEDDHFSAVAESHYWRITPTGTTRWALVRSVSKFIGPDLRLAFTVCDADTAARLEARLSTSAWVSHILQHLVLRLWRDPAVAALIARARRAYDQRRRRLLRDLATRGVAATGASGLNVWIAVDEETSAVAGLLQRGWVVAPGEPYRLPGSAPAVRVTIATLSQAESRRLASDVAEVLAGARSVRAG
jgi:DNA-binding transcriptional MocR family regulator